MDGDQELSINFAEDMQLTNEMGKKVFRLSSPGSFSFKSGVVRAIKDWSRNHLTLVNFHEMKAGKITIEGEEYHVAAHVILTARPVRKKKFENSFKARIKSSLGIKLPQ